MTPYADPMTETPQGRQLTGRHVLLMVVAFFGVLILVNGIFIYQAVDTFRGEDVERSYRQGLDYNATIDARRTQASLGWTAEVESLPTRSGTEMRRIKVNLLNSAGAAVSLDDMTGLLRHPVDTARDIPVTFGGSDLSILQASAPAGRWVLIATAHKGDASFTFRKELIFE